MRIPHPIALAVWDASVARFRIDFDDCGHALAQVIDLASEEFYMRTEGKEEDPRFAAEAPHAARLILCQWVLKWAKPDRATTPRAGRSEP